MMAELRPNIHVPQSIPESIALRYRSCTDNSADRAKSNSCLSAVVGILGGAVGVAAEVFVVTRVSFFWGDNNLEVKPR